MRRRSMVVLAVLAVLAGSLVACSSGKGAGKPTPSASASFDSARALDIGRRFAQCARDNGFPSLPDPEIQDGKLVWPAQADTPNLKDQLKTIMDQNPRCKAIMDESNSLSDRGRDSTPGPSEMVKLQAFAKCMRDHGIEGFPDPKPGGTFPLVGTPLEQEGKSERVLTALDACKDLAPGKISIG